MLSIADQIQRLSGVRLPNKRGQSDTRRAEYRDRVLTTFEFVVSHGNVSAPAAAKALKITDHAAREHLRLLVKEGKLVSFRAANTTWYTSARPAPRRK